MRTTKVGFLFVTCPRQLLVRLFMMVVAVVVGSGSCVRGPQASIYAVPFVSFQ
ncbi:hypothetical protein K457DRAFT_786630 [Linnemannia elongata AG-77]|uniref:Uncharacterized protein n=1 Tax=Linnemannia elongata AG-77 TaxID=1314771 RepID=A0A197JJ79_9FUNG|nr:hypothetical protein K457DRAFT_786630 [Linnemannia elongata AG-77]